MIEIKASLGKRKSQYMKEEGEDFITCKIDVEGESKKPNINISFYIYRYDHPGGNSQLMFNKSFSLWVLYKTLELGGNFINIVRNVSIVEEISIK